MRQNICTGWFVNQKKRLMEREFKQTGCGIKFYDKSVFKRHLFIHEKNMPFPSDESFHRTILTRPSQVLPLQILDLEIFYQNPL